MKRINVGKIALLTYLLLISVSFVQPLNSTDNQAYDKTNLVLDQTDSTIENVEINPIEPSVDENITVQADVSDTDGLSEVLLFWKYDSFNTTYSNTTMTKEDSIPIVGDSFEVKSITSVVLDSARVDNWYHGNYTLDNWEISNIDLSLDRENSNQDFMVYYKIQIKNITTGNWEIVAEDGTPGGDDGNPGNFAPITYTLAKPVNGINIYAEIYATPNPRIPILDLSYDDLVSAGILHSAEIQGIPDPSFVSYFIQAKDSQNNITESEIFYFLIDSKPAISAHSTPAILTPHDNTMSINVTVSDADGYQTIASDGVVFSYKLLGEEIWVSSNLVFNRNISLTESIYTGTIPYDPSADIESLLMININVTDTVDGRSGYTTSVTDNIVVDFKGPTLTLVELINMPDNSTSIHDPVIMEAVFSDFSGISNVSIFYRVTNDSQYIETPMLNMSALSINDQIVRFNITLPAANEDAFVFYYFYTKDFLNNTNTTPTNYYYADGLGPMIYDDSFFYKSIVLNSTGATIVFNATDVSGIDETRSRVFYSYDDGAIWYNNTISPIDYASIIKYQEVFTAPNLPAYIENQDFTNIILEINRKSNVHQALLKIDFSHELPSDLRMWLNFQDTDIIIFDRLAGQNSIELDLFALGFIESDFDNSNFTLVIQDFSEEYVGTIDVFEIELISYELPFPYQYSATIKKSFNDTEVVFFIGMYDNFGNMLNSSLQTYYSDGLIPEVSLIGISSPLDLNGSQTIDIEVIATDAGGIENVELYYRFTNSSWKISQMYFDADSGRYHYNLIPESSSGDVMYYVRVYDRVGYQTLSNTSTIIFFNGLGPFISVYGDPFGIDPIDMNKGGILPILANVTDNEELISVKIFYKFEVDDDWENVNMTLLNDSSTYTAEINLPSTSGKVIFKIQAIDNENIISETEEFVILYENAASSLGNILLWGGGIIGVAALAFILFKLFSSGKIAEFVKSKRPS